MKRKAQLLGHIIVFVIGLFIISAILLFGYQVLDNLNEKRCEVTRVQFGTDLKNVFNGNKDWGSNDIAKINNIPCETTHVCFIDRRISDAASDGDDTTIPTLAFKDPQPRLSTANTMRNSLENDVATNVFTIQNNDYVLPVEAFNNKKSVAPIQIEDNSGNQRGLCIPIEGGILELGLEGTGQEVEIYIPP